MHRMNHSYCTIVILCMFSVVSITAIIVWIRIACVDSLARRKAGRIGELYGAALIKEAMNKEDVHLRNVFIEVDGMQAELDNVVINKKGIFIIEIKNYKGLLSGNEDEYYWIQAKASRKGFVYHNKVKNPIKQVKRQAYILSRFLKAHKTYSWVYGYVYLIGGNSPVQSSYILATKKDIDYALHRTKRRRLTNAKIKQIPEMLSRKGKFF